MTTQAHAVSTVGSDGTGITELAYRFER